MKLTKTKLAAAVAMAALGVGMAMPASAGLLSIRLTDATQAFFTCPDSVGVVSACDLNPLANEITLNPVTANAALGGALAAFTIVGLSAASNFITGNPNAAVITSSGNLTATLVPGILPLIIEVSQTDWLKPVGQNRTLSQGATTTFTNAGTGDFASFHALNDQANLIWAGNLAVDPVPVVLTAALAAALPAGAGDDFVTPNVRFNKGPGSPPGCTAEVGFIQSCAGVSQLGGILETNPFSLTQRIVIATGASPVGGALIRVQFTDAATKFATVPEPASVLLFGAGILGLALTRRRKKIE